MCVQNAMLYGMKDRGPKKTIKNVVPTVHEPGIKKSVLRGYTKSSTDSVTDSLTAEKPESDVAANQRTPSTSVNVFGVNVSTIEVSLSSTLKKKSQKLKPSFGDSPSVAVSLELNSLHLHTKTNSTDRNETFANEDVTPTVPDINNPTDEPSDESAATCEEQIMILNETVSVNLSSTVKKKSQKLKPSIRDSSSVAVSSELSSSYIHTETNSTDRIETFANENGVTPAVPDIDNPTAEPSDESAATCQEQSMILNACENSTSTADGKTKKVSSSVGIHLQGVKTTQSRCFICQSNGGRKAIPWPAIQQAWFEKRCYVPKTNRTCDDHLTYAHVFNDEALQKIEALKRYINVETTEFEMWLHAVSVLPNSTPYNFEEDGIEPEKYEMLLGIDKESFDDLLQYLKGMRNTTTRSLRTALAMFLLLLRNNMKQEVVAHNFSTTQQVVSKAIDAVSSALDQYFVPKHLGYYHITREEALEKHSIKLTSKVLGQSESRICVIADGTYNYIEKPSDFELQRKTFSLHKSRNLLKPLYIVFPDGYILEAAGPYFCDSKNNDAANIRHHYKNSDLLLFLEEGDYFLLDRGYRDVVDETVQKGFSVFMPSLLTGKRTSFDCDEANSSRMVTIFRWVVEAVNGRIKNVFPFFKHTIEGTYVPKIMRFNRIACAIMNKYFRPLTENKEFHNVIAEVCANEIPQTNELKDEIEKLGLKRRAGKEHQRLPLLVFLNYPWNT